MFRVLENLDGSTSIFCNETGRLICSIRGQQRNMGVGGCPLSVAEPTQTRKSCYYNVDPMPESSLEEDQENNTREKELETWDEPKEDFYNECVTPDEFSRCLNLVSKEKLKTESIDQLKSTFPLRHISRIKDMLVKDSVQDEKILKDLPLTSTLGLKIMKLNQQNFYSDENIEKKATQYDSFCRFQSDTSVYGNFPNLRCRDKKEYPICISQKFSKYRPTHMYAFNRRQQLEKLTTFKTGLDTYSRKLLQRCNKRLAVNITRLAPEEIDSWLQKGSKRGPVTPDCIIAEKSMSSGFDFKIQEIKEYTPQYIDLESLSSDSSDSEENSNDPSFEVKSSNTKQAVKLKELNVIKSPQRLSPLKKNGELAKWLKKSPVFENCSVKVKNVLHRLKKCYNGYYIAGTNISVPFCQEFLNRLDPKVRNSIVIPGPSQLRNNHLYHCPYPQVVPQKRFLFNSQCLNHKTPKTKKFEERTNTSNGIDSIKYNNVKNSYSTVNGNTMPKLSIIPIIDLTKDPVSPVRSVRHAQKRKMCNWKFHCYACDFQQNLIDEITAYSIAKLHMKNYHYALNIESFLSVKKSSMSGGTLEAFPGYNS